MKRNYRLMTLEVIYQLLLVAGIFSAIQWVISANFDPASPWLVGIVGIPLSLLLNFVNYFIRERINTIRLKKLRGTYSPDLLEDLIRNGNF